MSQSAQAAAARLKILVPTSFSSRSEMALEFALNLTHTQAKGAEVYLFHSYDDKRTDFRFLDQVNADNMERMRLSVLRCIDKLRGRGLEHSVEAVHRRLSYGKPWAEILKVAGGIGADMIVMGHAASTAFRRLTERVPCTLVMVKEKDPTFIMD